jgi:hypothetical protein
MRRRETAIEVTLVKGDPACAARRNQAFAARQSRRETYCLIQECSRQALTQIGAQCGLWPPDASVRPHASDFCIGKTPPVQWPALQMDL